MALGTILNDASGYPFPTPGRTDRMKQREIRKVGVTPMRLPLALVGDEVLVPCVDGVSRRYVGLDAAASTGVLPSVMDRVLEFLPSYSSVHRGAGYKSQLSTTQYENARDAALRFAGREGRDDVAIICRNTTEAINHLVYRLGLRPSDVVVTTVIEHHANLLPWSRVATCRYVECLSDGTFTLSDVESALDVAQAPAPHSERGVEHHRLDAPARRDHRSRAPSRDSRGGRWRATGSPPAPAAQRGLRRLERAQDVRPLRRGRAHRST